MDIFWADVKNKLEKIDGKWYYFGSSGYMVTGWINKAENEILTISSSYVDENICFFDRRGHMLRSNGRGALV